MAGNVYKVVLDKRAEKALDKMDASVRRIIGAYIDKNLVDCKDPRALGKGLIGDKSGLWRYRVGNYRILANIEDESITIFVIKIGHRSDVYKN